MEEGLKYGQRREVLPPRKKKEDELGSKGFESHYLLFVSCVRISHFGRRYMDKKIEISFHVKKKFMELIVVVLSSIVTLKRFYIFVKLGFDTSIKMTELGEDVTLLS